MLQHGVYMECIIAMRHTCEFLAERGSWDLEDCCPECHENNLNTFCFGLEEYDWLDGDTALLCCEAFWYFYGYDLLDQ